MRLIPMLLLLFSVTIAAAQGEQKREEMTVDGMKRAYVIYTPAKAGSNKMPLIISLHGGLATPKGQFHLADFRPIADTAKFIVICPASKHIWHDGSDNKGIDDVKFIDQLISYAIKTYNADPERVYVTGISNGGFMTSRLACQLSNRIAAIAIVAATLNEDQGYAPIKPMPVIYMHGSKDPLFSINGGKAFGRVAYSHEQVLKVWADMDKCGEPVTTTLPDTAKDGTSIIIKTYTNPTTGFKVVGYTIVNGGHTWPGGWQYMPGFIVGKTTKNLNACQVMWDFFRQYRVSAVTPE